MAQTIKRKTQGVRRQAKAQSSRNRARKARSQGKSLLTRMLGMLPISEQSLHRIFTVAILGGAVMLAVFVAQMSGATKIASDRMAHIAGDAGFKVRHVDTRGIKRMNKLLVEERALGQDNLAMTRIDLAGLRAELLALPWVKDARVFRQLPDVLVVDIVEREPHAVLARADRLMLIDDTGVELEPISRAKAKEMLLIEGPGAQSQVEALSDLLDAAPALRTQVKSAEWVGNRRWNLTFGTDQRLALPEGPDRAAAALISFARADGVHRLIGGEVVAFDLRNPPRMFMRKPGRAEEQMTMGEES